jgi:hypothetical protein
MHFQLQLRHGQRQTWFWTDVQELSHALNSFNAKRQMVELLWMSNYRRLNIA